MDETGVEGTGVEVESKAMKYPVHMHIAGEGSWDVLTNVPF